MTSDERVEEFKRELGLILRQILGLDQETREQLPQVADEETPTALDQS
jgi:hypothetical protein